MLQIKMRGLFASALTLVASCLLASAAAAQDYDAARDFSKTNNPNGTWRYGYSATKGGAYALLPSNYSSGGVDIWDKQQWAPSIWKNPTENTINLATWHLPAKKLAMHPSPSGEYAVLRWTAPATGTVNVEAVFTGIDPRPTTTDVAVIHNASERFSYNVSDYNVAHTFSESRPVIAGDTIDFIVGYGGNGWDYDATMVDAVITYTGSAVTLSNLVINPASVSGGRPTKATVNLSAAAPTGGALVTFTGWDANVATGPNSIVVPKGKTSATFSISTKVQTAVQALNITAHSANSIGPKTLTVLPIGAKANVLSPDGAFAGDPVLGTVVLDGIAPAGGVVVTLTSSNSKVTFANGQQTHTVTVPGGAAAVSYPVTVAANATGSASIKAKTAVGTKIVSASLTIYAK